MVNRSISKLSKILAELNAKTTIYQMTHGEISNGEAYLKFLEVDRLNEVAFK